MEEFKISFVLDKEENTLYSMVCRDNCSEDIRHVQDNLSKYSTIGNAYVFKVQANNNSSDKRDNILVFNN